MAIDPDSDLERQIVKWNAINEAALRDFSDGGNRLELIINEGIDDDMEPGDGSDLTQQPPPGHANNEERPSESHELGPGRGDTTASGA